MDTTDTDRGINDVGNRLQIVKGDITELRVDAIVNAASHSLLGMAGVSGAILRAAGPELYGACAALGGCEEGQAIITGAYELAARDVIHTVAPVWYGGYDNEELKLAKCYRHCFQLIKRHQHRTVAFPSIGTGAHNFPLERAARLALREILDFLNQNITVTKIVVVCFDDATLAAYEAALEIEKQR